MSYQFPDNLNYADTHEYVLEENGLLKIGVSEFAIDQLGDIVFVELADQGATLEKGETFGTIESVKLNNSYLVQKVCQSFQNSSPVDSFLNVIPSPKSGYDSNLLMSGGTFIEGSTSEFSADAPLRNPYNIFVQGGSHMTHIKIALIRHNFWLIYIWSHQIIKWYFWFWFQNN